MKTQRSLLILALAPSLLLMSGGCSKTDNDNATAVVQDIKTTAVDTWDGVKDFTFEKHTEFSASIDRMSKAMDDKIAEVKAKAPDAAAKDKDAAVRDYDEARANLKARLADLNNASADTWADAKAKVADAWQRVKAAYTKATS
ncbi:MAG TPA: hypothetical protein VN877_06515 [Opitutaceae bacterium]|nr:hypothetical protein [Opitutaceae bacterium]